MYKACSGVTVLTLFDLVKRSMRKNLKHYYLYFFALIFSVVLYFVFATLKYDAAIIKRSGESASYASAFQVAGILLIIIAGIFIIYANAIFLRRRSREIGLYQLIGLTRGAVVRLLIIENILLSVGALVVGVATGLLVSRVFLLLLMKLIGHDGFIALSFSIPAIVQTTIVFLAITCLTSMQMMFAVYRNTLLGLFNANQTGENPKKPKSVMSALLAVFGVSLILFGYWLSGNMMNELLFFNMLAVLGSTILGTYLIFRISISWLFYQIRKRKNGHLGLNAGLSLASLMHRMKGNANSLTIITTLSAMTLAMVAGAYSLYYSTEKETRYMMPHDFMFVNDKSEAEEFVKLLEDEKIDAISTDLQLLTVPGTYVNATFPERYGAVDGEYMFSIYNAKQLEESGFRIDNMSENGAVYYNFVDLMLLKEMKVPFDIELTDATEEKFIHVEKMGYGKVVNFWGEGSELVVNDAKFEQIKHTLLAEYGESVLDTVYAVNVSEKKNLAKASEIFSAIATNDSTEDKYYSYHLDYYTAYKDSIEGTGLLIFIAGFLGLVFLISTGSILYFKQMTEAEQEKQSYATLRQLGFTVQEIMRGIIRKQVFVFGLPLAIGLAHSIFAVKAASFLFLSDITVPAAIAMGAYALIYLAFALLTVGYYRKVVSAAL